MNICNPFLFLQIYGLVSGTTVDLHMARVWTNVEARTVFTHKIAPAPNYQSWLDPHLWQCSSNVAATLASAYCYMMSKVCTCQYDSPSKNCRRAGSKILATHFPQDTLFRPGKLYNDVEELFLFVILSASGSESEWFWETCDLPVFLITRFHFSMATCFDVENYISCQISQRRSEKTGVIS